MSDDRADQQLGSDGVRRQRPAYTESQVIMSTVKAVVPFVMTYGMFMMFHGGGSPGGAFQGGALIASVFLMIAFAFGIDSTREWLSNSIVVGLGGLGVLIFGGLSLGTIALGGNFLEYTVYEPVFGSILGLDEVGFVKYGMEAVEIGGIAFIVAGILMGLFFLLAAGFNPEGVHDGNVVGDDAVATDGSGRVGDSDQVAEPGRDDSTNPEEVRSDD